MKKRKGIVLVVALMVLATMLILISVYFTGLITEKRSVDTERYVLQALNLAEAGASQAKSELYKRIHTDLGANIRNVTQSSSIGGYLANPLGLLQTYAAISGGQFSIGPFDAKTDLNSDVSGNYSATVTIIPSPAVSCPCNENPTSKVPPSCVAKADTYYFYYNYAVENATGTVTKTAPSIVKEISLTGGSFNLTITRESIAKYALFTFHHRTPNNTIVWFTGSTNFTGPVRTNERFSFANNPSGHFTADVTQNYVTARFFNDRTGSGRENSLLLNADYNSYINPISGQEVFVDRPIFDTSFFRGQPAVNLETTVSALDTKRQALGGNLSNEPASNGIYVINNGTDVTGGIYIKGQTSGGGASGDDSVVSMAAGANGPVYTITSDETTKIITVNYAANQTTIQTAGGGTQVLQGIPDGASHEGVLIYSNDKIKSFFGTVEGNSKVTISGEKDIVITNNIQYQNYSPDNPATPANELSAINSLTGLPYENVLGIISWGGNVRIANTAPPNIQIHAVVMAPNANQQNNVGVFTVDNYDSISDHGIATLLGGVITDSYGAFGTFGGRFGPTGYGRNFVYDSRVLEGKTPPYFPYLNNFNSSDSGLDKKLIWQAVR
jgi:hypothetical protein